MKTVKRKKLNKNIDERKRNTAKVLLKYNCNLPGVLISKSKTDLNIQVLFSLFCSRHYTSPSRTLNFFSHVNTTTNSTSRRKFTYKYILSKLSARERALSKWSETSYIPTNTFTYTSQYLKCSTVAPRASQLNGLR